MFNYIEMRVNVYAVSEDNKNIYKVTKFRQVDSEDFILSYTLEQVLTLDYVSENSSAMSYVRPDKVDVIELTVFHDESLKSRMKDEGLHYASETQSIVTKQQIKNI